MAWSESDRTIPSAVVGDMVRSESDRAISSPGAAALITRL